MSSRSKRLLQQNSAAVVGESARDVGHAIRTYVHLTGKGKAAIRQRFPADLDVTLTSPITPMLPDPPTSSYKYQRSVETGSTSIQCISTRRQSRQIKRPRAHLVTLRSDSSAHSLKEVVKHPLHYRCRRFRHSPRRVRLRMLSGLRLLRLSFLPAKRFIKARHDGSIGPQQGPTATLRMSQDIREGEGSGPSQVHHEAQSTEATPALNCTSAVTR